MAVEVAASTRLADAAEVSGASVWITATLGPRASYAIWLMWMSGAPCATPVVRIEKQRTAAGQVYRMVVGARLLRVLVDVGKRASTSAQGIRSIQRVGRRQSLGN